MKTVKTILFSIGLMFVFSATKAQGNLQFNQAKFIELTLNPAQNSTYPSSQQTITVPAGKVWKLESAVGSSKIPNNHSEYGTILLLNDKTIYYSTGNSYSPGNVVNPFPIWLPSGTYTLTIEATCTTCNASYTYYGYVSGIEFNITQ